MTGPGIFHGTMNFQSTTDDFIDSPQLFQYPSFSQSGSHPGGADAPASIALTEFHFVMLYGDRIAATCTLDEKLTYEELLPLVSLFITLIVLYMFYISSIRNLEKKFED